jgi:hypothetical protein
MQKGINAARSILFWTEHKNTKMALTAGRRIHCRACGYSGARESIIRTIPSLNTQREARIQTITRCPNCKTICGR